MARKIGYTRRTDQELQWSDLVADVDHTLNRIMVRLRNAVMAEVGDLCTKELAAGRSIAEAKISRKELLALIAKCAKEGGQKCLSK